MKVRTRFAPSPTGFMHIGNLRTALFEYLVAKSNDGDFILRIEDTDQTRKVDGAIDFIYDTLKLCNIGIDEGPNNGGEYGPYIQSERIELYQKYANELVENGNAYYCFCTEDRLNELRLKAEEQKIAFLYDGKCSALTKEEIEEKIANGEKYVIRQRMPKEGVSSYEDLVYGHIEVENRILEDQILIKSDGFPTYNFANVVDDHLMEITHIIRGNEYLMSTPKYNLLYDAFGWDRPVYVHVAMVLGSDGQKLSKRNGDASFMDLYNEGYLPEAVINYLALLGWSPETNDEIFTMDELIKIFNPKRINKAPSSFDVKKLQWINSIYLKKLDLDSLISITKNHLLESYDLSSVSEEWLHHLISIYQDHIAYGKEIVEVTDLFFKDEIELNSECIEFLSSEDSIENTLNCFKEEILNIKDWSIENINQVISSVKEKSGAKGKLLFMPIRIKVSGQMHGPELVDTIFLIGRDKILKRLS